MSWLSDLLDRIFKGKQPTPPSPAPSPSSDSPTAMAAEAIIAINAARQSAGVYAVLWNPELSQVSQKWAAQMAVTRILTHGDFAGRIKKSFPKRSCGECVAEGQTSGGSAIRTLLKDPPHREIILNPNYTLCGIGVAPANVPGGELYWVIDFVA